MIREEFEEFQEKWLKNVTQEQLMKETESKPPYEEPVLVINEDGLYAIAKYKKDVKGIWCDEWCIFNTPYDSEGWQLAQPVRVHEQSANTTKATIFLFFIAFYLIFTSINFLMHDFLIL